MKHVCRICLTVINDLNFVALKTDEPSQMKTQLSFCVPEMVVDLVKDPVFCKSCVSALQSAYNFKKLCLRTEEHIKNLKISHSNSINIMDALYDLLQSTNGVCEDNGECKSTREGFVITPNMNILLSDEDLANGQNLNSETQRSVTVSIDSFNKTINANSVTSNGFSKLSKQTSVDELVCLLNDALWNTSVQPLSYEEEVKNDYKDITIDEDFSLPKMEPSWSYEGYENTSFEDSKSGDCTTDNENNRASVETNTVIQDCFVKLTRLPNNILYNNVNKNKTSVDELDSSLEDVLWNTSVQPLTCEEEVKNEYKDITIDEDFPFAKLEPSWSYEGYEKTSFEDAKSGDCTTDNENNRASVQTNTVIQDCFVKLTRLPNNTSYNNVNKSYYQVQHLKIHTDEKPYSCDVCTFRCTLKSNLQLHLRTHTGEKPFSCNVCDYCSAQKQTLKEHLKIHTGEKPFVCNACEYRSAVQSHFRRHLRIHTSEKPFVCNVCDYRFARKAHLKEHLKIHTGEKPYSCDVCTFSCTLKSNLQRHLRTHTGEKPFVCNVCHYRTAVQSDLPKHLRIHTGEKPFICNVCDYRCAQKSSLKAHLRIYTGEKPFVCNVCNNRFPRKSSLKAHLRMHTGEKPFVCNACEYRSAVQSHLRRHVRMHTGEKPFVCNVCDHRFTRKSSLKTHLRMHTHEKSFICNMCDYRFARKTHLKQHVKIHTGEKPFACTLYDYRSARKAHLMEHLKIHTGEKPFACNVCTFRFLRKSHLHRHLRIHAGEKT